MQKMKDRHVAQCAMRALTSTVWFMYFQYVLWISRGITHLERWGDSCPCHQDDFRVNRKVECPRKGRMLAFAWAKVVDVLSDLCAETEAWTEADWDGNIGFWYQSALLWRLCAVAAILPFPSYAIRTSDPILLL